MGEVGHGNGQGFGRVHAFEVSVARAGVEVVGDGSPAVFEIEVNNARGVVGVEHDAVVHDVVAWVERIKRCASAVEEPENIGALIAIKHAAAIGVRVRPVRSSLILYCVRYAVAVEIVGLDIVGGVVFRIGPVKVLASVVNPTLIRVKRG